MITFIRDGEVFLPEHSESVRAFCEREGLDVTLEWRGGQFWLRSDQDNENPVGVEIDRELTRHVEYFKRSSIHKELLARAIGIKGAFRPSVLDLTAGLLGDTMLFLAMGCEVRAVERHPVVAFLMKSALAAAQHPLLQKLQFIEGEASSVLLGSCPEDVGFYDPMFEDPNQKSLPRKEMRIFRTLVGGDADVGDVLTVAREKGPRRLVVKRPRLSVEALPGKDIEFAGKATRYDVYLRQSHANHIK